MALSESEELELLELENEEAQGGVRDSVAQPRTAADSGEALLTNLPTQGFKQDLVRGLPAAGGGMAGGISGAAMGAPFGPIGIVAGGIIGAGIGAMSGEASRQAVSQGTAAAFPEQNYPMATGREVLRDVGIQGAMNAGGQALGVGIGAAAKAGRPFLNKVGGQFINAMTGVPERAAQQAMRDPSILLRARPASEVGKQMGEYLGGRQVVSESVDPLTGALSKTARPDGLKYNVEGLQELLPGKFVATTGDKFNLLNDAVGKLGRGELGLQEALVVRQQASQLLGTSRFANPEVAAAKMEISQIVDKLDEFIEPQLPEIGGLRNAYRESKVADEFSSLLPLKKNLSPNAMRSVGSLATAASAAGGAINPVFLAAPAAVSPYVYGAALKGAALVGKVPGAVYRVGTQAGASAGGSALADAYSRQRPAY